ncbi:MAG: ubiquitin-like domain-containing protein [Chloroflexota bacterium]|nr:ubiquitin-like domain-containing protein [Chloroflexota bacterium]
MSAEAVPTKPNIPPGPRTLVRSLLRRRNNTNLWALLTILAVGSLLTAGYLRTGTTVTVVINGLPQSVRTHQATVGDLLREIEVELHPEDIVQPALDTPLQAGQVVLVRKAQTVSIQTDGRTISLRTHEQSVAAILRQAALSVGHRDRVMVNSREVNLVSDPEFTASPARAVSSRSVGQASSSLALGDRSQLHIVIHRAIPIYLDDDGATSVLRTTLPTVGETLRAEGITLYLGDEVHPSLGSRVSSGMRVYIRRARPVEITVDEQTIKSRTRHQTVAEVLAAQGITLVGRDYVEPDLTAPVTDDVHIRVVRVREAIAVEQEPIAFETAWQPDAGMELDQRRLVQEGEDGVHRSRLRMIYHDGHEVSRVLEDEWVAEEPTTKVIAYGTNIVIRDLQTPDGTFQYWRKIRMLVTAYTEATCGKEPDHPHYGITYLGWRMHHGIVAVDPRVINLRSEVYVFGYGKGVAGDTGGGIKGHRIDLGYDVDNFVPWYHWRDVYLLTPVPPANRINWILPNWPQERR